MSTQRFLPKMRKGMGRSVVSPLSLLAGVLLLWQLVLPSVALAFQTHSSRSAGTLPTPAQAAFDLASVSVVRLVATYTSTATPAPGHPPATTTCTGLGVLVGSAAASTSSAQKPDFINWVLTDSVLITPTTKTACTPLGTSAGSSLNSNLTLSSLQIASNAIYGGGTAASSVFGSFAVAAPSATCVPPACLVTTGFHSLPQGGIVFAFHTSLPQPFVNVATSNPDSLLGIELARSGSTSGSTVAWPTSPQLPLPENQPPAQFLVPVPYALTGALPANEPGMPLVNSTGELTQLRLARGVLLASDLNTFLASQPDLKAAAARSNGLQNAWQTGVKQFYAGNYAASLAALQQADGLNPNFQALSIYETKVTTAQRNAAQTNGNTGNSSPFPSSEFLGIPLWILAIIGLVVLLAIFVLVSLSFGRKRAQQRRELARFKADQAEAQRMAEIEVERQRQTSALGNRSNPPNQQAQAVPDLHCPVCNYPVLANEAYCPNCHTLLSPSASELHLLPSQPAQPLQPAQQAPDATWPGNYPSAPPQMSPQQAAYAQQPSSLVPASSISEQPTIEMSPDTSKNGQFDAEKTVPYSVQQVRGRNLSLAVGYRTDPGIKRKHKPNEDSLFAMQGARTHNSQPQEFGLFVVADGMGGHANGQDASRLAIQTIIDYILPKVTASNNMDDAAFLKLLSDGVQCANEAVHKRNMEERADMGTTMTAALIVGSTAYIANVGDSRTYLYREPDGLQKITRDHSVVASLVDAGIIQPDDIYTHPKRNQIYRSLGEKPVVEVDSFQIPLQAGDKLLLCSDGLWDMVRDPEIQRVMSSPAPDPNMTGNALIKAALDGGGEDNVSVIVVSITETSNHTGMTGIQLLAKPDSVTVPEIPSL